jgi:hypothetical protein
VLDKGVHKGWCKEKMVDLLGLNLVKEVAEGGHRRKDNSVDVEAWAKVDQVEEAIHV